MGDDTDRAYQSLAFYTNKHETKLSVSFRVNALITWPPRGSCFESCRHGVDQFPPLIFLLIA